MSCDFSSFTNAMRIGPEGTTGTFTGPGPSLPHQLTRALHVRGDLAGQVVRGIEPDLVPEPLPELHGDLLTEQAPLESEQERLHVHGLLSERGIRAHVDRGGV